MYFLLYDMVAVSSNFAYKVWLADQSIYLNLSMEF